MKITRTDGIKIDFEKNRFEQVGSEHQEKCRAYDTETGKYGYIDTRKRRFFPDKEKEVYEDDVNTGLSYGEIISQTWKKGSKEISDVFHQGNKEFLDGMLNFFRGIIRRVATATYAKEIVKHPEHPAEATRKAERNASCVRGIFGVIIAVFVITFLYFCLAGVLGSYANLIYNIALFACGYTIFGLIRVMCDRTFFISIPKTIRKIRTLHVPFIAYVGIVIASLVIMFRPMLWLFDELTMEWFGTYEENFTNITKVVIGWGLIGVCALLCILVGVVLCLIVKMVTAKA